MEKFNKMENIEVETERATFFLNPKIYPLDVIYSASYILMDSAFILLDGNPQTKITVEIIRKEKDQDIRRLVEQFNRELLNYLVYKNQSEKNKRINEIFMEKILLENNPKELIDLYKELKKKIESQESNSQS